MSNAVRSIQPRSAPELNEYNISPGQHALHIAFTDAKETGVDLGRFALEMYQSAE